MFLSEPLTQPGNCEFRTKNGELVMEGKRVTKLYELSLTVEPPPVTSPAASSLALVTHPRDRSDNNGMELWHFQFTLFLDQHGIHHELSATCTPQQNGFLERDNQTVMECARSMLHACSLPTHLWAEGVNCAVYLLDQIMNKQLGSVTPYQKWFAHKPSVSHYRVFGSLAYVYMNKEVRTKLDPKSLLH